MRLISLVIVALFLSSCGYSNDSCYIDHLKYISGRVVRVIDGDTVEILKSDNTSKKIRLLNIDTPETKYYGKSQGKYGVMATERIKELLPYGTIVRVYLDKELYSFDRILGHIVRMGDDLNINKQMLKEGWAALYVIYPNIELLNCYSETAHQAIIEHKGIFSEEDPLLEQPFEFRVRVGNRQFERWVGNLISKLYWDPLEYTEVPLEYRLFFNSVADALQAGYAFR